MKANIILAIVLVLGTICVVFQRQVVIFLFRYCALSKLLDKLGTCFLSGHEKELSKQEERIRNATEEEWTEHFMDPKRSGRVIGEGLDFQVLLPIAEEASLVLIGYVKSESDFSIIRKEKLYYIRSGNRPGSMQYGQLCKPIKWLLLHHNKTKELYELISGEAEKCEKDFLKQLGFNPSGNDYWLFRIKRTVNNPNILESITAQINTFKLYPQLIKIEKTII